MEGIKEKAGSKYSCFRVADKNIAISRFSNGKPSTPNPSFLELEQLRSKKREEAIQREMQKRRREMEVCPTENSEDKQMKK